MVLGEVLKNYLVNVLRLKVFPNWDGLLLPYLVRYRLGAVCGIDGENYLSSSYSQPAIRYASEGYPVSPVTAQAWKRAESKFLALNNQNIKSFHAVFFPQRTRSSCGRNLGQ